MTVEGATLLRLERYIAAILRRRWLVVALATLVMLATTAGVRFITVTNDYHVLFSADNPQLAAFNALENTYSVSNTALIAIAPREGSVFTREALGAIEELTEAAWRTPYSSRVNSLTNYTHSEALEDELIVAPLVEDRRQIVNGLLYLTKTGGPWALLPPCFGPWKTVYDYFRRWSLQGVWPQVLDRLTQRERRRNGRGPTPSAGCIDSHAL